MESRASAVPELRDELRDVRIANTMVTLLTTQFIHRSSSGDEIHDANAVQLGVDTKLSAQHVLCQLQQDLSIHSFS